MATPEQFSKRMRQYGKQLGEAANLIGAQAGVAIGKSVVRGTPIDTGRAKSNWQASRVNPRTRTRPAYAKGKYDSTEAANEAAAIAQIVAECRSRKNNQPLFITNNLDYIGLLESSYIDGGHKRKTPVPQSKYQPGFVQIALQAGREEIRNTQLIKRALSEAGISGVSIEVV